MRGIHKQWLYFTQLLFITFLESLLSILLTKQHSVSYQPTHHDKSSLTDLSFIIMSGVQSYYEMYVVDFLV